MAKPSRSSNANQGVSRSKPGGGFLLGMFVGLILGLASALGIAFYLNKTPIPFMTKKPGPEKPADAGKPAEIAGMPSSKAPPPAPDKPKFDFYKILPGSEEAVSDKDLKAAAKAKPDTAGKDIYFLQAGSFQNPADADNRKAQLAILGFEASVEPVNLPDKGTWYRVRMGPYTKIDEINRMRSTMATNGIDVSLVKIKDPAASARTN